VRALEGRGGRKGRTCVRGSEAVAVVASREWNGKGRAAFLGCGLQALPCVRWLLGLCLDRLPAPFTVSVPPHVLTLV
jgi:hypothetical protein